MKSQIKFSILAILTIMIFAVSSAFGDVSLKVSEETGASDEQVELEVTVEGLDGSEYTLEDIAGAAWTFEYDSDIQIVPGSVQSKFFDTFVAQFEAAGTPEPYSTSAGGYDQPLVDNPVENNKTAVAAARCIETDGAKAVGNVLFTLKFELKDGVTPKETPYDVNIKATILDNTAAGYDENGEPIDLLVGADLAEPYSSTEAYPVMIGKSVDTTGYSGSVTFGEVVDTDNDGLSDSEEQNLGTDLNDPDSDDDGLNDGDEVNIHGTDPNNSDTDNDGYCDKEEIDAGTDPLDETDHPTCSLGDVNCDGSVSLDDVKSTFNFFLGASSTTEEFDAANVYNDGDGNTAISLHDVQGVFTLFLGGTLEE
ncbi:hypothetical protein GMMP15_80018 [Candidatus Magnetomoraceae bacterium gMMP-15]